MSRSVGCVRRVAGGRIQNFLSIRRERLRGSCVCESVGKSFIALSILMAIAYPDRSRIPRAASLQGPRFGSPLRNAMREVRGSDHLDPSSRSDDLAHPAPSSEAQSRVLHRHNPISNAMARPRTLERLTQGGIPDPNPALQTTSTNSGGRRQRSDRDGARQRAGSSDRTSH